MYVGIQPNLNRRLPITYYLKSIKTDVCIWLFNQISIDDDHDLISRPFFSQTLNYQHLGKNTEKSMESRRR